MPASLITTIIPRRYHPRRANSQWHSVTPRNLTASKVTGLFAFPVLGKQQRQNQGGELPKWPPANI
jgi:hypothetical protein